MLADPETVPPSDMLNLTKRTEYGLIALLDLADRDGQVVSVREIGERYPIPPRILAQTLQKLNRAGIIESQRGATGGYSLTADASTITVGTVVAALEGAPNLTSCQDMAPAGPAGNCDVEPMCPIRSPLHRLREGIWTLLQGTTLRSLADSSLSPVQLFSAQRDPLAQSEKNSVEAR